MAKECAFCNPGSSDFPHFKRMGVDRIDLVHLAETDRLIVKSDIIPASPLFHALIIPKEHKFSFAHNHGLDSEVGHLIRELEAKAGELAFFEHGGFKEGSKIQSVYHNHAHLIATGGRRALEYMADTLSGMNVDFTRHVDVDSSPAKNVRDLELHDTGYIYIQQGHEAILATDTDDNFPSQITQRSMSKFHGRELNWKEVGQNEDLAKESVTRILQTIATCQQ
jgi:diadenosine tetraphosphate (Ap4A) HIT family hydrolase